MQISFSGKHIDITDALKEYAISKLKKLNRFYKGPMSVEVLMNVEHERQIVEITTHVKGMILRVEESSNDMYASIDSAVDKLEARIKRYKDKIRNKHRSVEKVGIEENSPLGSENDESGYKVVKEKEFEVKPISVDEAIMQMEMLGHSFFVFRDSKTDRINVLYKRKDGNYGLIKPVE